VSIKSFPDYIYYKKSGKDFMLTLYIYIYIYVHVQRHKKQLPVNKIK